MAQQALDKGAQMLQSLKPVKQMSQHVCSFALFGHDLTRQIETHHYVTRLNQDFLQCAVYDSDDSGAHLIGTYHRRSPALDGVVFLSERYSDVFSLISGFFFLII